MLELRHLHKAYPGFSLEVDAALDEGVTALFGVSGSGKTTILNCVAGLTKPDAGEVRLGDRVLYSQSLGINLPPERRGIGYVFQDDLLFPHLRVKENLRYGFRLTPRERRRLQVADLVPLLQLEPLLERYPATLSGGEAQRVALARALATSPDLLLLDEPLASLDLGIRGRVLRYLGQVWEEFHIPMVYVSHSISEVMALASKALVLDRGKAVAYGPPDQVLALPEVFHIGEAAEVENLLSGQVIAHSPEAGLTQVRLGEEQSLSVPLMSGRNVGERAFVAIRAADIILSLGLPQGLSARNILPARVEGVHAMGTKALVYARAGALMMVEVSPDAVEELGLREGQEVFLIFKSSAVRALEG